MDRPAACLFDLDGLLLDTEPLHGRAWREAAARFGRQLSEAQLRALRGRRRFDCADQVVAWIGAAGGPRISREALLAVRQPIAEALLANAPPMPGAEQLVRRCHELAIPMALVTSSAGHAVARKAGPHPWLALIAERVYGDDPELDAGKPAPDMYLLATRRLGVTSGRCWAFEDSAAGVRSALAAGCRVHALLPEGEGGTLPGGPLPAGVIRLRSLEEVRF